MEQRKEAEEKLKNQLVIGMDISRDYLQISYLSLSEEKPVTVRPFGREEYNIPMCVAKRKEMNQWSFGREAEKCAALGKGILIRDLFTLAKEKKSVTVEGKEISGEELFFLYIKKCYGLLNFILSDSQPVSLMITVDSLKAGTVELLKKVRERLPLDNDKIFLSDRQESLYYYVLNQPEELWHYQVAVFDFTTDRLKSYTFSRNVHTTPIVAMVDKEEYEMTRNDREAEGEEEKREKGRNLDEQFLKLLTQYVDGKLLSSVYFIGEGFLGAWYEKSLRFLCKSRRVFEGNNLYSKGACFGAREKIRKSNQGSKHIFLGEEKLKFNLGILVKNQGTISYCPLLDGGENWYEAKNKKEFMIEGGAYLSFLVTPLEGGKKREICMELNGFEAYVKKERRILLELSMIDTKRLKVLVTDKGFGEIFKASGMSFAGEFSIDEGTEPIRKCNLFQCTGTYGTVPFKLHKYNKGLYSMEELCYYLCENAHLLDRDFMGEELITFIDEQCHMEELSQRLRKLLHFGGSLSAFVSMILEECTYKNQEEMKEIAEILKENETLSVYERKKNRADYLMKEEKYALAIEEYAKLYLEIAGRDPVFEGKVLHNIASAYGRLLFFDTAAGCFKKAYDKAGDKEDLKCYLLCKRMELTKGEYVAFTSSKEEYYEISLELERELEQKEKEWEKSKENEKLEEIRAMKEEKNAYYQALAKQLESWKEEYLDKVLD